MSLHYSFYSYKRYITLWYVVLVYTAATMCFYKLSYYVSGWHCPYWIFWRSHNSVFG